MNKKIDADELIQWLSNKSLDLRTEKIPSLFQKKSEEHDGATFYCSEQSLILFTKRLMEKIMEHINEVSEDE